MRWPSFFGRSSAAKASRTPEVRAPIRDWASLPAIQRAAGETELTAPTAQFVQSLAGMHEPDLSLEPLGHHVTWEGPAGLVTGLIRNVETYAPSSELVGRPRGRRDAPVQRRMLPSEDTDVPSPAGEGEPDANPEDEPVLTSFHVIDQPVRASAPLTRLADSEASAVLRLALPRPVAANPVAPPDGPAAIEAAPDLAVRPVSAQRLTLGQSRRLGLGAPLSPQSAAAVQRSVDAPPLDLALPARVAGDGPDDGRPEAELQAGTAGADEPLGAATERTPTAPATIQRHIELAPAEPSRIQRRIDPDSGAQTSQALVPQVIQRVVARPLPPTVSRPSSTPTSPVAAHRSPLLTLRRVGDHSDVAVAPGESVTAQRLSAAVAGQAPVFAPGVVGETGSITTDGLRPLPPVVPAALPVQRVNTIARDSVAVSPGPTLPLLQPVPGPASPIEHATVQREVDTAESSAVSTVASAAGATAAGAGAEAAAAPGHSDRELDELARKLHDRISLHLRRDLLVQRERAGMVTDL